jgi:hypothetical protein
MKICIKIKMNGYLCEWEGDEWQGWGVIYISLAICKCKIKKTSPPPKGREEVLYLSQ